jgi:excisionase family DNA binding protein
MTHRRDDHREFSLPATYLTPADLAELLRVPLSTIYQWRYQRIGPRGFRVGKHLRFDPRAVGEWIDSLTEGAA